MVLFRYAQLNTHLIRQRSSLTFWSVWVDSTAHLRCHDTEIEHSKTCKPLAEAKYWQIVIGVRNWVFQLSPNRAYCILHICISHFRDSSPEKVSPPFYELQTIFWDIFSRKVDVESNCRISRFRMALNSWDSSKISCETRPSRFHIKLRPSAVRTYIRVQVTVMLTLRYNTSLWLPGIVILGSFVVE